MAPLKEEIEKAEREMDRLVAEESDRCQQHIKEYNESLRWRADGAGVSCPPVWDGILCWDEAPAGQLSVLPCPKYIVGFAREENATRQCTDSGEWYVHPKFETIWANYSQCAQRPDATIIVNPPKSNVTNIEKYLPPLKAMAAVGYTASLVSLLFAFCILVSVKKLRCPRNTLHLHLFASFIMRAFMTLLKDSLFVNGLGLPSDISYTAEGAVFGSENTENWECKMITSLWQYFIMANYYWILMEGLYLHNLIFCALFSDSSAITLYVTLGWGVPALFVVAWVSCRVQLDDVVCWTISHQPQLFLLVRIPIMVSIGVSFLLFLNIVRVLFLKLRASVCEETRRYRRWAKSTLILVPLFGVHYAVFAGFSLQENSSLELVYLYGDQLFASFQGFFVAVLYCFLNGEVRAEVARQWRRLRRRAARSGLGGADGLRKRTSALGASASLSTITAATAAGTGGAYLGGLRAGPLQLPRRCSQPRASCYSTTSCTSLSVAGSGGGARSCHSGLADIAAGSYFANVPESGARVGSERRWSSRSDYSIMDSALEMQSMGNI